jgi:Protein of unknown function (DUF3891)
MLIREEPDGTFLAIGQASHAWVSGQLARAWGNDRFGLVEPWEEVCLAAEQHDVGWALWDLEPTLDPATGRPHTFISLPIDEKLELWSGAARRVLSQSRYAAVLVSMHGTALYERWPPADPGDRRKVQRFISEQLALQERLSAGIDPAELRRNQRLVFAWDYISLALCLGWAPTRVEDVPTSDGAVNLELAAQSLEPWPFADEGVSLRVEGRRLHGRFEQEAALHAALADSSPETLHFELRARR